MMVNLVYRQIKREGREKKKRRRKEQRWGGGRENRDKSQSGHGDVGDETVSIEAKAIAMRLCGERKENPRLAAAVHRQGKRMVRMKMTQRGKGGEDKVMG